LASHDGVATIRAKEPCWQSLVDPLADSQTLGSCGQTIRYRAKMIFDLQSSLMKYDQPD
jgi:hypothetical protein